VSAERAALGIIEACRRGSARLIIGAPARTAVLLNELFPGAMTAALSLTNRLLPGASAEAGDGSRKGSESESSFMPSALAKLAERAAVQNNQVG